MRSRAVRRLLPLLLLLLAACGEAPPPPVQPVAPPASVAPVPALPATPPPAGVPALQLDFVEQHEAGGESVPLRMLVTAGHLRIDDGTLDHGFILFDRTAGVIHSVSQEDGSIITIAPAASDVVSPLPLELATHRSEDPEAPTVGGRRAGQVDYLVNGRLCYRAAVVPELLPDAQRAERDYLAVLATEQRAHVDKIPPQMWDPCDLSRHVFAPTRHFDDGYPVQVWDATGYRRGLVGFDADARVDPALFELPEGFDRFDMGGLR